MTMEEIDVEGKLEKPLVEVDRVTIRFAGDSGDGMQLTGSQFSHTSAIFGNDISTLPDFPAEIRAPAGSIPGVSGFQINFSSRDIRTPGDEPNVLVAMNPAALKVNLADLEKGAIIVVNSDAFTELNLKKANYLSNPIEDGSLAGYRVMSLPLSDLTANALQGLNLTKKEVERCKNFFALGLMYWLYDRSLDPSLKWIEEKFANKPTLATANKQALRAGLNYADTTEIFTTHYKVRKAELPRGHYRNVTGNEAAALGFVAASQVAKVPLFYASYPITPASDILHELSHLKNFGVKTFQAEDEIAAMSAAIGAAFAGQLALTGTSGPGVALKSEAIGLAVMTELPVVIANVQRGGPSTGLPTKTEQADLFQAVLGRNGECPLVVLAAASPADCFHMAFEAFRLATRYMTPVFFLSDGYIANGSEPWRVPAVEDLPKIDINFRTDPNGFYPYLRDEKTLSRPWVIPGTPGMEHRIGGLEKQHITGDVSYNPENHDFMVRMRAEKIARVADDIPDVEVFGKPQGKLLVVGWGGTYGAITTAVEYLQQRGRSISSIHLRYLNPFPKNLGEILRRFETVLVPELNLGQLVWMLRAQYLLDAKGYNKVQGMPFKISELVNRFSQLL
jgi:2-oxoglutarate ferredoxin oxidoreductase subunit alpha